VSRATGQAVRATGFRGVVAGKTGTSSNAADTWFVGYTPDVVGAVWIGYDRPSPLGAGATGGAFAAPVWGRVMSAVYSERPAPGPWGRPDGVVARRIDPNTGLLLADGCYPRWGEPATELFLLGHESPATCPSRSWGRHIWGLLGEPFGGGRGARARTEQEARIERQLRERERALERQRRLQERELERQRRERERQARRGGRGPGGRGGRRRSSVPRGWHCDTRPCVSAAIGRWRSVFLHQHGGVS
jgi:membrane peptidoglycan carboxypeptidase